MIRTRWLARLAGLVVLLAVGSIAVLGQAQCSVEVTGSVVSFDEAFGSVGTDITAQALQEAGISVGDLVELRMSGHVLEVPVVSELFPQLPQSMAGIILWGNAYIGGWYRNIAAEYDVALGDEIGICLAQKEGYLDEIAAREVDHVESRDECTSDEEYANFREVRCGNIAAGVLFRSSHPADGSVKSAYAHALMVEAGVKTVINVGASWNEPQQAFDNSEYYRARGDAGAVLATNIGLAVTWPHFKAELGRVLRFIIDHDPPYLVHCSLGQDRAGITSAVLEALAGADLQDVIDDYALTFANYYRITPGHLLYSEVVEQLMSKVREMNYGAEVTSENLQDVIARYLTDEVGLSDSEVHLLQQELSGSSSAPGAPDESVSHLGSLGASQSDAASTIPVIYDDDGSPDIVYVLAYLLRHPGVDLQAVTVSVGEAHPSVFAEKLTRLLTRVGHAGIPVAAGSEMPLQGENAFPDAWRTGSDSFWGISLPDEGYPVEAMSASQLIVKTIKESPQQVTLIVTGTQTNVAEALRLDPAIVSNIKEIVVMGGAIYVPGNIASEASGYTNSVSEWNIWVDPVAASEVFSSRVPIRLVPLDATNQVVWNASDAALWLSSGTAEGIAAAETLGRILEWYPNGTYAWDLDTAVVALGDVEYSAANIHIDVITARGEDEGRTVVSQAEAPNARVCLGLDSEEVKEAVAAVLRGAAPSDLELAKDSATAAEVIDAVLQGHGLEEVDGRLVLDDFDDGDLTSKLGFEWRSYTGDGGSLASPIRVEQSPGSACLLLDAVGSGFVGIESGLGEPDLSGCDGIYIVVSTKVAASVALNLRSKDEQWPSGFRDAYVSRWVSATDSPETVYLPFSSLAVEAWRRERCPTCDTRSDPTQITSLQVELAEPSAELRIYEVGFYKDAAPVAPIPEEAKPGVDGYAVILETYDRVDTQIEPPVHINRDRIVDALTSLGWAEKNMFVVLDHAVTTEGVESAFEWLGDRVTEEDIVFFYVAGHGSYMKQAVHLDEVASDLWESLSTARKLLVVDTCMAGKFTTPAMYGEFLLPEEVADSGIIPTPALSISACQYDEFAWGGIEEEGLPIIGLVMTYYLAEALRDPTLDQNGDGFTSVEEAFAGVYARTQAYMRDFVYQVPEFLAGALEHSPDLDPADYPHPELIDGFPGELILDLRYHQQAAN